MKDLGICLGLAVADQYGQSSTQNASLDVLRRTHSSDRYVNVDVCSASGIQTANSLGFASQQPADVVYSGYFRYAAQYLFDDAHQAAVFGLFRDPITRAVSLYYYLQHATWEQSYKPEFQNMTLKEYALHHTDNNRITRTIAGKTHDNAKLEITQDDLENAKQFLRDFVVVGLTDEMDESIVRFARLFGWDRLRRWKTCRGGADQGSNRFDHPQLSPGDEEWELLMAKNEYDLELYRYAQELFVTQRDFFR